MGSRAFALVLAAVAGLIVCWESEAQGQQYPNQYQAYQLQRFYYYPYYYFPHNYWPAQSPRWPEPQGHPYMKPPAYMAYPPFLDPKFRHEMWQPQRYYRGFHFWLDQF